MIRTKSTPKQIIIVLLDLSGRGKVKLARRFQGRESSLFTRQYAAHSLPVENVSHNCGKKKKEPPAQMDFAEILALAKSTFRYFNQELFKIAKSYNVRAISPKNMANLSLDLYIADYITRKQYLSLSYQVDFSPRYNQTIGALIGEVAAPDKKRDYIALWRKRLLFEHNYFGCDFKTGDHVQSVLSVLLVLEAIDNLITLFQKTKSDNDYTSIPDLPALSLKRKEY